MPLTECTRCHTRSTTRKAGVTCGKQDAFQEHPCGGTMRVKEVHKLGLKHLVKHMRVWEQHMLRLERFYTLQQDRAKLIEARSDRQKMTQWRERLESIEPRRDRKADVSVLQGDSRSKVQEPKREPADDTTVH